MKPNPSNRSLNRTPASQLRFRFRLRMHTCTRRAFAHFGPSAARENRLELPRRGSRPRAGPRWGTRRELGQRITQACHHLLGRDAITQMYPGDAESCSAPRRRAAQVADSDRVQFDALHSLPLPHPRSGLSDAARAPVSWGGNSSRLIPSPILDRALGNCMPLIPECPYDVRSLYAYCL